MATVLQPIVNELNTVLVQLRTELRGLQTDADGAGIAIERTERTERTVPELITCLSPWHPPGHEALIFLFNYAFNLPLSYESSTKAYKNSFYSQARFPRTLSARLRLQVSSTRFSLWFHEVDDFFGVWKQRSSVRLPTKFRLWFRQFQPFLVSFCEQRSD